MDILIRGGQLILALAILVTLHEFGNFIPARLFKTRIERFYLFFNPWISLVRFKKIEGKWQTSWLSTGAPAEWEKHTDTTEWGFGWLPLGGYVKIAGMIDESMDTEQMKLPAQDWEFRSKKAWQRLIIMIGGVVVNLVLGFIIYIGVITYYGQDELNFNKLEHGLSAHPALEKYHIYSGDIVTKIEGNAALNLDDINKGIMFRGVRNLEVKHADGKTEQIHLPKDVDYELFHAGAMQAFGLRSEKVIVEEVVSGTAAAKANLKKGDVILAVNNQPLHYFDELQVVLYKNKGKKIDLLIQRNKKEMTIQPNVSKEGTIGFQTKTQLGKDSLAIHHEYYGLGKSISLGSKYGINTLTDYISQFKFVFTKKGATSIGGFASIGKMFEPQWEWESFWLNTALLSIILAFMNILPIPALDGGHVIFLIYEMITGKEAPQKVLETAQMIGIFLLLGLMLYANGNDIIRFFFK